MTPVDHIIALLIAAKFRQLPTPITIGGVKFNFAAVLISTEAMPDLVIVADTTLEKDDRVRTKVEAVARALDVVRSKRPLTLVLAGPRPGRAVLDALSRVCRVLPVGVLTGVDDERVLRNWLRVLMPLDLPHVSDAIADPMRDLVDSVAADDPVVARLLAAAPHGVDKVRAELHQLVQEPLDEAELDEL